MHEFIATRGHVSIHKVHNLINWVTLTVVSAEQDGW